MAKKAAALSSPGRSHHSYALGAALYRAGEWQAATAALEWGEPGGRSLFFLALCYQQLGDAEKGKPWYDKALSRPENNDRSDEVLLHLRAEAALVMATRQTPPRVQPEKGPP